MDDSDENFPLQARNGEILPLDFLEAVMTNEDLPLAVRMRAAVAAAQYRHPKLAATQNLHLHMDIGARLDRARERTKALDQARREGRVLEMVRRVEGPEQKKAGPDE